MKNVSSELQEAINCSKKVFLFIDLFSECQQSYYKSNNSYGDVRFLFSTVQIERIKNTYVYAQQKNDRKLYFNSANS